MDTPARYWRRLIDERGFDPSSAVALTAKTYNISKREVGSLLARAKQKKKDYRAENYNPVTKPKVKHAPKTKPKPTERFTVVLNGKTIHGDTNSWGVSTVGGVLVKINITGTCYVDNKPVFNSYPILDGCTLHVAIQKELF
jgi:hypothetical protein